MVCLISPCCSKVESDLNVESMSIRSFASFFSFHILRDRNEIPFVLPGCLCLANFSVKTPPTSVWEPSSYQKKKKKQKNKKTKTKTKTKKLRTKSQLHKRLRIKLSIYPMFIYLLLNPLGLGFVSNYNGAFGSQV